MPDYCPKSSRGLRLVWAWSSPPRNPTITVEFYGKWYEIFVAHPDGMIQPVTFDKLEEFSDGREAAYVDHVPNPNAVLAFAAKHKYFIDPRALEIMVGRWEMEVLEHYQLFF